MNKIIVIDQLYNSQFFSIAGMPPMAAGQPPQGHPPPSMGNEPPPMSNPMVGPPQSQGIWTSLETICAVVNIAKGNKD